MNSETVSKNSTGNEVDPMQIYKVIIAARNNVAEARNGPSEVMTGIIHVPYVEYCDYIHLHVQCAYNSYHFLMYNNMLHVFKTYMYILSQRHSWH